MATTVSLIQMLSSGVVHPTTGAILASGVCRFYQPGTLTPQTVYSDNAGASAISPPLVLTAGGTGIAYTINPIRMIIKDATDVTTLYDVNVNTGLDESIFVTSTSFNSGTETRLSTILDAWNDSASANATLAGYFQLKMGTSERNIRDSIRGIAISVKDYGALGNDAADDTTAIQNAISSLTSGGKLIIEPGTYRISSPLSVAVAGITIEGAGFNNSIIKNMSTTGNAFNIAPVFTGGFTATNFGVLCNTVSSGTAFNVTDGGGSIHMSAMAIFNHRKALFEGAAAALSNSTFSGLYISGDETANTVAFDGAFSGSTIGPAFMQYGTGAIGVRVSGTPTEAVTLLGLTGSNATINITATAGKVFFLGVKAAQVTISNGAVSIVGTTHGTTTDSRVGTPVYFTLAATGSVTPLPQDSILTKIVQSGGAAVTTINAPSGNALAGLQHTVICSNTSGGALTWTWNAAYKISAAVAPATGNSISVIFVRDSAGGTWVEVSRSAAVPN